MISYTAKVCYSFRFFKVIEQWCCTIILCCSTVQSYHLQTRVLCSFIQNCVGSIWVVKCVGITEYVLVSAESLLCLFALMFFFSVVTFFTLSLIFVLLFLFSHIAGWHGCLTGCQGSLHGSQRTTKRNHCICEHSQQLGNLTHKHIIRLTSVHVAS